MHAMLLQGQQPPYAGHVIPQHGGVNGGAAANGGGAALYGAQQAALDQRLEAELQRQQQEHSILQQQLVRLAFACPQLGLGCGKVSACRCVGRAEYAACPPLALAKGN